MGIDIRTRPHRELKTITRSPVPQPRFLPDLTPTSSDPLTPTPRC